jgi:RES domain-containing protein
VPWETTAWRIAAWDTPLWIAGSRRAGRYNRAGDPPTQYLCLHPWGPWAELLRWSDRRTREEAAELSTRLWSVRLTLPAAPRRITFDDAAGMGIDAADLVSDDHTVCQELADEARSRGDSSVVVPSAALAGTENLVVFGPRAMSPWQLPPVDVDVDVPAAVAGDRAGSPLAVLPHVRWRGEPHRGLAGWQAGRPYTFLEPVPTPLDAPAGP